MKKYKHRITGDIVQERHDLGCKFYTNEYHSIPSLFVEKSYDWEEIIEVTPYIPHYKGDVVTAVTRIVDGVFFNTGMYIKMPDYDKLGFIYGFNIVDGKLIINHTFSYLMDKAGIKDHLAVLRPCLYTKEDILK